MKFNLLNRKIHYWASITIALPTLLIICTGILLQMKKQFHWVQPPEVRGAAGDPAITMAQILEACRSVPEAAIATWGDIDRLDVRPGKGMLKVQGVNNRWEIQIDTVTAEVLQVAYRRSDLIESLHDGSFFFSAWTKLGLFLPTGVTLLLLWMTGMYLFLLPHLARRRKKPARG